MSMMDLKFETDHPSYDNSCFICHQLVSSTSKNDSNSLNLLFNYLKIKDKINSIVCEKCEKNFTKFVQLCGNLEKIKLEMDYLLDSIQSAISNSKKDLKPAPVKFNYVLETIMKKSEEKIKEMFNSKPIVVLERIPNISKVLEAADNDVDFEDNQSLTSHSTSQSEDPAIPVIDEIGTIRTKLEPSISKRRKCPDCHKIFSFTSSLNWHLKTVHRRLEQFSSSGPSAPKKGQGRGGARPGAGRPLRDDKIRTVEKNGRFVCVVCGDSFTIRPNAIRHFDSFHEENPIRNRLKCPHCRFKCFRKDIMATHRKTHLK